MITRVSLYLHTFQPPCWQFDSDFWTYTGLWLLYLFNRN